MNTILLLGFGGLVHKCPNVTKSERAFHRQWLYHILGPMTYRSIKFLRWSRLRSGRRTQITIINFDGGSQSLTDCLIECLVRKSFAHNVQALLAIATARLQFLRMNDCSLTSRSASLKRHSKPRTETWHPFYSHVNTGRWPNSVLMVGQRRRRWANIKTELGQRLLFVGGKYQID